MSKDVKIEYRPTPRQLLAHNVPERNILFGGAVGGGKSVWLVNDALSSCIGHAGCVCGVFRYEFANFKTTTYTALEEWVLDVPNLVKQHNQQDHWIELFNGSKIIYGGLKPSSSAAGDPLAKIKSLEMSRGYIDEVSDVPESLFKFFSSRLGRGVRGTNITTGKLEYPRPRMACSSNPAMGWVKSRWIDNKKYNHRFIQSKVSDNPHLSPQYEADLREEWAENPEWIAQFLEGDWSAVVDFEAIFPSNKLIEATKLIIPAGEEVEFGVDVGAHGDDPSVVVMRQGMKATMLLKKKGQPVTDTARQVAILADTFNPTVIRVDTVGVGVGVFDILNEQGYPVEEFIGGAKPNDKRFRNKRAEAYWGLRNLLCEGRVGLHSDNIEWINEMVNEMGTIRYLQTESDRVIQVESKKAIKKRLGHSPDICDAVVYAFEGQGFNTMSAMAFNF